MRSVRQHVTALAAAPGLTTQGHRCLQGMRVHAHHSGSLGLMSLVATMKGNGKPRTCSNERQGGSEATTMRGQDMLAPRCCRCTTCKTRQSYGPGSNIWYSAGLGKTTHADMDHVHIGLGDLRHVAWVAPMQLVNLQCSRIMKQQAHK
jgi:hypothetical protein